jgi:hypothetical protein
MGFLALAFAAVVTSAAQGAHTAGTLGSLVLGFSGAAYCSVQGLRRTLDDDAFTLIAGAWRRR